MGRDSRRSLSQKAGAARIAAGAGNFCAPCVRAQSSSAAAAAFVLDLAMEFLIVSQ
jgi:hypothetical protein